MTETRQVWNRSKVSVILGLILFTLHIISCTTLGSRMYIWDYVAHRKGFNWNGRIKRFGQNSRISDYWSFLGRVTPSFDNSSSRNVTTQIGQTVYLHCIVHNLGDKTVSWIRRKDFHVLTVGLETYTTDARFQAIHMERTNDWSLQIRYPQLNDAGLYECQVGSDPKISFFVNLNVVEAKASILGPHPLYIKTGSSINLTCVITQSPVPPVFVFWFHNERMINYDSSRGEISLQKAGNDTVVSKLYIKDAQADYSGNYTCGPSNADSISISVYILNGEQPAAMQHDANASKSTSPARVTLSPATFLLLALFYR
ncbi:peroxidasin homolog [Centruroides vittatus]|uniref:peroxidasin homolog n=1 Tax=Centruroides vittatus TaxID=120091 RepID=UPI00350EA4CF